MQLTTKHPTTPGRINGQVWKVPDRTMWADYWLLVIKTTAHADTEHARILGMCGMHRIPIFCTNSKDG